MASGAPNMQNHVLVNLFNANGLRPEPKHQWGHGNRGSPGPGSVDEPPTRNHMVAACLLPGQRTAPAPVPVRGWAACVMKLNMWMLQAGLWLQMCVCVCVFVCKVLSNTYYVTNEN